MKRYLTIILLSILPNTVWCDNVSEGVMDNIRYMINYDKQEATMIRNGDKYSGKVVIPERVWDIYPVVEIGWYSESLFDENTTEVDIPASVRNIRQYVFNGCFNLKKVNIHDLESWMSCSFFMSNPLEYGADLFLNGEKVTKVVVPQNFKIQNSYCFSGCNSIDSVEIHDSVYCAGFSHLKNLRYVSISDGCTFGSAFADCPLLTSAGPKGSGCTVEYDFKNTIPSGFLDANNNLKELRIPSNIVKIENYAFNTERLENIYIEAEVPPTVNENPFLWGATKKCNLYVPKGTKEAYEAADVWKDFNIIEMIKVEDIYIGDETYYIDVDESEQLNYSVYPLDAVNKVLEWSSDKEECVKVDSEGVITGLKIGEATITAKTTDGTDLTSTCKVYVRIPLSKVLLDKHSVTIYTGGDISLIASVSPESATYKTINWTSSKPSVATVDENGKVTAVSNGTAKIYARSTDGTNLSDSCTVTIKTLAKSIQMSKSSLDMIVGEQMSLSTTVLPATTSDKRCTWTSSNPNVATVSSSGSVTAVSTGVTTITATTTDGSNLTAKSSVTVTNPVISVSLNKQVTSLYVGQTTTLIPYCVPENADNTNITWASSNETTAVVQNGVVTAKALGTAVISATSVTGKTAKCTVNVVPTPAAGIILNAMTLAMTVDEQFNLTATVKPDDTTNKTVKWTSNNVNVVAVSSDGKVTAKKSGTAIITVRTTDGSSLSATCTIVVTSPVRAISMNKQEAGMFVGESVQITASCSPLDADNTTVSWTSSNNNIATVSKDGKIKAVGAGVATITATTTDGTNLSASCRVTVSKNNQTITWNQTFTDIAYGGEMTPLDATATSGMKIRYKLNDESVAVIFDLGDVVYLNPANCGKTTITAWQEGNYAYEKTEMTKEVTVTDKVCNQMSTLVAYYSNSSAVSSIVVELANQLAHTSTSVTTKDIKSVNGEMNLADYGAVVMVYPLCDGHMAEPMLNFLNVNSKSMTGKAVSYVEYGEKNVTSANAKALHITVDDLERKEDLISEWIYRQQPTSIQSISSGKATANNMHDLQGRKLTKAPRRGIYIENGIKKIR